MAATKYLSYEGLSYLWGQLKTKFGEKQDVISDLSEIRSNASTGAGLKTKVDGIAEGAQVNVIETIKVNNAALTVTSKEVNIEVPTAATSAPLMDGTAAVGSSTNWAKADHVHPSDTTKVDVVAGKGLSTNDFTDALLTKLNGLEEGGQVNVIETVKVNNVALSVTDKAVSVPNATTSVYGATVLSSATNSTDENSAATPLAVKTAYDLANGKQDPATTLAGYGITDASIANGVITLGSATITPITASDASSTSPVMDGTATVGTSTSYARADHVHPSDTTKADKATTLAGYGITDAYTKTQVDAKLTSAMHYKGSVPTAADLPASNNEPGDFYNVADTGENYAWAPAEGNVAAHWDIVGNIIDLQAISNNEIDTIVAS